MGRDAQEFTRAEDDFAAINCELQRAGVRQRNLFVEMAVHGNNTALLQKNAGDHDLIADDELTIEEWVQGLDRDVIPADVLGFW